MALIRCAKCDREYSDTLNKCPHCNYEPNFKICPECGKISPKKETKCAYCGFELEGVKGKEITKVVVETEYNKLLDMLDKAKTEREFEKLKNDFELLGDYKSSKYKIKYCEDALEYERLNRVMIYFKTSSEWEKAMNFFKSLNGYKDSELKAKECEQNWVREFYEETVELDEAKNQSDEDMITCYEKLGNYKDSAERLEQHKQSLEQKDSKNNDSKKKKGSKKKVVIGLTLVSLFIIGLLWGTCEIQYRKVKNYVANKEFYEAKDLSDPIVFYKDTKKYNRESKYQLAEKHIKENDCLEESLEDLQKMKGYKETDRLLDECNFKLGIEEAEYNNLDKAKKHFEEVKNIPEAKVAAQNIEFCKSVQGGWTEYDMLTNSYWYTVESRDDPYSYGVFVEGTTVTECFLDNNGMCTEKVVSHIDLTDNSIEHRLVSYIDNTEDYRLIGISGLLGTGIQIERSSDIWSCDLRERKDITRAEDIGISEEEFKLRILSYINDRIDPLYATDMSDFEIEIETEKVWKEAEYLYGVDEDYIIGIMMDEDIIKAYY